jgi:hypothetical protein
MKLESAGIRASHLFKGGLVLGKFHDIDVESSKINIK